MPPRSRRKATVNKRAAASSSAAAEPPDLSSPRGFPENKTETQAAEAAKEEAMAEGDVTAQPVAVEEVKVPNLAAKQELSEDTEGKEEAAVDVEVRPAAGGEEGEALDVPQVLAEAIVEDEGGEDKMNAQEGVTEERTPESDAEDTIGTVASEDQDIDGLNDGSDSRNDADDASKKEIDPSLDMHLPTSESERKEFEIFVGGLAKDANEEDLSKTFGNFGEIQSVRIVKNLSTKKNKGFAFIRYATIDSAKKALTELKDGIEVKGKQVGVSASQVNATLYLGNICKTWTKDQVVETLKSFGVEEVLHIVLPLDPNKEMKTKGFAFLEFASHSDAMLAFQRLRKPDALFGCDRSAKVAFAQTPINPNEELLLQVKTVYVECIPSSWDEEKLKELCKEYGDIDRVEIIRKLNKTKRKDFAFIEFSSRENALACIEGVNSAQIGEGEVKVSASLARPISKKRRLAKQGTRGGFKVNSVEEGTGQATSSRRKNPKSKEVVVKESSEPKLLKTNASKPSVLESKRAKGKGAPQKAESVKGKKHGLRGADTVINERPPKKARRNRDIRSRPSNGFGSQRIIYTGQPAARHSVHQTAYTPSYACTYQAYAYSGPSGSNIRQSDLEPHAGYLPVGKHIQNTYGYDQRRADLYDNHQRRVSTYAGASSQVQNSYPGYRSHASYEAGYAYHRGGSYSGNGTYAP
ncbi:uncharacterized protein [Typha latifolia]|uniref:uncharacterized protein isoform X2 n=1 Tax=Typha latifolia TaxID=4733 RepID=UPI003C2E4A21